ncbi:hypothetical protein INR49_002316 [Caranx melampygus]|nr:hypothetical protein INR49_002316 [Caranx melampygus]
MADTTATAAGGPFVSVKMRKGKEDRQKEGKGRLKKKKKGGAADYEVKRDNLKLKRYSQPDRLIVFIKNLFDCQSPLLPSVSLEKRPTMI